MTVSSVIQLQGLLYACGFGFLLGVWYDGFLVVAYIRPLSRIGRFIADMAFCLTGAVFFFLFALTVNGGHFRWYLFCGTAVGFLVWRITFGRLLLTTVLKILKPLKKAKKRLLKQKEQTFVKIDKFLKKTGAKTHIFFIKHLHPRGSMVYNKNGDREHTEGDG